MSGTGEAEGSGGSPGAGGSGRSGETAWERRRRLAAVFGDGLPETTSDEREPGEDARPGSERGDTWLKEQVPPHHGNV